MFVDICILTSLLTLLSPGRNPSEPDSVCTLLALRLLSEPISEKSRQNEHNQQPLKREIRNLGVKKKNVIVCRPKFCTTTKLTLENCRELECGKEGETAWNIYRRTAAFLLSDTQHTSLRQRGLTELHAAPLFQPIGYDPLRCCYCGLGVCFEGIRDFGIHQFFDGRRHPLHLGWSLRSAGLVGHLCCLGSLSFC